MRDPAVVPAFGPRDGAAIGAASRMEVREMSKKEEKPRVDVYARITDRIVADLERGVRPWMRPWSVANTTGRTTRPLRYNGEPYSGMNVILLWSEAVARGFASPVWMTFKQASELGGHVRKGESGSLVVYASRFTKTESDGHGGEVERDVPFLKTYTAFNVEQIDCLPDRFYGRPVAVADPVERIDHADRFFANTGAAIRHGGSKAFYSPSTDHIRMPPFESFRDAESYVAVLSHETVHWTADSRRVGRDLSRYAKDRSERAREELVAEIGSAMLCADLDIVPELEPRPDHASYIASWLEVLANDKRAIFSAAAHAQRAVTYLHGLQPQSATKAA
jgi:antirestriction protein ArdC